MRGSDGRTTGDPDKISLRWKMTAYISSSSSSSF